MSVEIKPIGNDTEEDRMLNKYFKSVICNGFVEIGKDKFVYTDNFTQEVVDEIRNKEIYDDDIFIAAHPKTGTTWIHELVLLLMNDLDYGKFENSFNVRRPFLEAKGLVSEKLLLEKMPHLVKFLQPPEDEGQRTFKTHLQWSLLPEQIQNGTKKPKIIITLRNPCDVCVSFYHHSRVRYRYTGTFEEYCQLFMAGRVHDGPYWKQVLSYWNERDRPNLLFVGYREMKEDFPAVVRKVAKFLGKTLTEEEIAKLTNFLSFDNMKNNKSLNLEQWNDVYEKLNLTVEKTSFFREGKEGGYKTVMSPEMIKAFDDWTEKNIAGTGLSF